VELSSILKFQYLGIMTQCAVYSEIPLDEKSLKNYGGINTRVNFDIALKNKKSGKDFYMFFGADVIHPTNITRQHPSIAGMEVLLVFQDEILLNCSDCWLE
jgi:hypothetical protein